MEESLEEAKNLIYQKNVSLADLLYARNLLVTYGKEDAESETVWGFLSLAEARIFAELIQEGSSEVHIEEGKEHFYRALNLQRDATLPHYGLYQLAVLEGDYEEALYRLSQFDRNDHFNFSLSYALLGDLIGQSYTNNRPVGDYIQNVNIGYLPIRSNYRLATSAFQNQEYDRVVKHLEVCEMLSKTKNIYADFASAVSMAKKVYENHLEEKKQALKTKFAQDRGIGNRMMTAQQLLRLDTKDAESFFYVMDAYLELKVFTPLINTCEHIHKLSLTKSQEETVALYERIIAEKQIEATHLKDMETYRHQGESFVNSGNIIDAIDIYRGAYQRIGHPIYHLEQAKLYYQSEDYTNARIYIIKYMKEGFVHYQEAATLLYQICYQEGNKEEAMRIAVDCYRKMRMKEKGCALTEWLYQLRSLADSERSMLGGTNYGEIPYQYTLVDRNSSISE